METDTASEPLIEGPILSRDDLGIEWAEGDGLSVPVVSEDEGSASFQYLGYHSEARLLDADSHKFLICTICSKDFRRETDLDKHQKAHRRPWRCSNKDCFFHEDGFRTEEERDRHFQDRHAVARVMLFQCKSDSCDYTSERVTTLTEHIKHQHPLDYKVLKKDNHKGLRAFAWDAETPESKTLGKDEPEIPSKWKCFKADCAAREGFISEMDRDQHVVDTHVHGATLHFQCKMPSDCEYKSDSVSHLKQHIQDAHPDEFERLNTGQSHVATYFARPFAWVLKTPLKSTGQETHMITCGVLALYPGTGFEGAVLVYQTAPELLKLV